MNNTQTSNLLVLWKHELGSRTFGPHKHMTRISIFSWPQVSMSCTHSKKNLHAWTMFRPDRPSKRFIGNLPQDSVHILIHNMTVCIFIYMHHTFTTVKYWLQSQVSFSYIDIRSSSSINEGHSVDTSFCNQHLTSLEG